MQNTIIYIIGFPGTGKYTVAKELCRQADTKLVDNHLINNPVFSLIELDGKTNIPTKVWKNVEIIRKTVLHTIETLAPSHFNFVLTNMLLDSTPEDHKIYEAVEKLAKKRKATFIPIHLSCDPKELIKRVANPKRAEQHKEVCPIRAKERAQIETLLKIDHPNFLRLDNTHISPEKAAEIILEHIKNL